MRATVFTDGALSRQAGRFVWLSINTEKRDNAPVLAKYPVQAWPSFYVIDPQTETVVLRYVGGMTLSQLDHMLDDGARAASKRGAPAGAPARGESEKETALARADRLFAQGKNSEAGEAYREALATLPASAPSYPRVVESLLFALSAGKQPEPCAVLARDSFAALKKTPSAANVAAAGLDCALDMPASAAGRKELVAALAADAREVLASPSPRLAPDDVSGLFQIVAGERKDAADEEGRKKVLQEWAAYLEGAAARGKTAEARSSYDSHRISAYLALGQPERAIPMLEATERDLPDDYNAPARLAVAYREMKRYDDALAAVDRALAKAYGPRKLLIFNTRADVLSKKGDVAGARKTLEDALAYAESLPKEQRSEGAVNRLKKQLESLAKDAPTG